jgi:acyl dehydratase
MELPVTSARTDVPSIHFGVAPTLYEGVVDAKAAVAFAEATSDPQPAYLEGHAIPPLYSAVLLLPAMHENLRAQVDHGAIINASSDTGGVHGEHDVFLHAPLDPDQEVRWDSRIRSASMTAAGALVTLQLVVRDLEDNPLVEHLWSTLYVKCTTEHTGGPPLPDHRYPESAREHLIRSETFAIPRNQGEIYREASGDGAGHAVSDEIAQAEGYPSKILQGMCTFAMCSGAAIRVAGGGDPDRLRRFAGRFASPVIQGLDLTVEFAEIGIRADGTYEVAFEARQGDTVCISHGRAEFGDPR